MAWTYLAESADSQLPWHHGLDRSPTVRVIDTRERFCFREWPQATSVPRPSGTMFGHSTGPCCHLLISCMADSPARISALREMVQAWKDSEADWYWRYSGLSKKYGQRSSLWKTSRPLERVAQNEWGKNWPRSGMIVDGELFPLSMWERRTKETDGFCWPTSVASDDNKSPAAHMAMKSRMKGGPRKKPTSLQVVVKGIEQGIWPTPTVLGNYNRAGSSPRSGDGLATAVGGKLNPNWVEWLMGYPIGWTVCADWAMPLFQRKRGKRSKD